MSTMRAIQVHAYGDANQLRLEQISQPTPQEGEVLVRVHAAGVNALDWKIRSGFMKSVMPSTFPYVPGIELAGVVERIGPGVTTLQPGQEVYGHTSGGALSIVSYPPRRLQLSRHRSVLIKRPRFLLEPSPPGRLFSTPDRSRRDNGC